MESTIEENETPKGAILQRDKETFVIAEDISREDVISLTKRCLEYYAANGNKKECTAQLY
jgi:hypothetical protein